MRGSAFSRKVVLTLLTATLAKLFPNKSVFRFICVALSQIFVQCLKIRNKTIEETNFESETCEKERHDDDDDVDDDDVAQSCLWKSGEGEKERNRERES